MFQNLQFGDPKPQDLWEFRFPWAMRQGCNFRVDFLSLPKASWGPSCIQNGPAQRGRSDLGGAPRAPWSVPAASLEAVWSQKEARSCQDTLEISILNHFDVHFGPFFTHKNSSEPLKSLPANPKILTFEFRSLSPIPTVSGQTFRLIWLA